MTTTDRADQILRDAGFGAIADFDRTEMGRPDAQMLQYAARQIAQAEEAAERELTTVADRAARALTHLAEHTMLNSLGEIQGAGLDADRAVAVLSERWQTWSMLAEVVKRQRIFDLAALAAAKSNR